MNRLHRLLVSTVRTTRPVSHTTRWNAMRFYADTTTTPPTTTTTAAASEDAKSSDASTSDAKADAGATAAAAAGGTTNTPDEDDEFYAYKGVGRMPKAVWARKKAEILDGIEDMRLQQQAQHAPMDTPLASKATRLQMWRLHTNDPIEHSVRNLARRVGMSEIRAHAVLVGEGLAQAARERGEWVGDASYEADARACGFKVLDVDVDPRDRSISESVHRSGDAMLSGEVDEVAVQQLVAGTTAKQRYAMLRAKLFPREPPPGTPIDAIVSKPLRGPTRRTLNARVTRVVYANHQELTENPDLRLTVKMHIIERDGSARTASWADRVIVFTKDERRPPGLELEPIEHVRRHINTPVWWKGRPSLHKPWLEYERTLVPISVEQALAAEDAAALAGDSDGAAEILLKPDDASFVDESDYDYSDKSADVRDAVVSVKAGRVVRRRNEE